MTIVAAVMVPHPPLIIPEVGRGEEQQIATTIDSYRRAAALIRDSRPDTVVVLSPHSVMYANYFHLSPGAGADGDLANFRAGAVRLHVNYDKELVDKISELAESAAFPAGTAGERDAALDHATLIPLLFLRQAAGGELPWPVVRIGLSGLSLAEHYRLGVLIAAAADALSRRVAVVASGDLSHRLQADGPYGFMPDGPLYDQKLMDVMGRAAFGELLDFAEDFCDKAGECGHRAFTVMAGCLDGLAVSARVLSYEGPFGVGYGVALFQPGAAAAERRFLERYRQRERERAAARQAAEDAYVRLARQSLNAYICRRERIAVPDGLPAEMRQQRAGVFVSLKKNGRLRGCIGTIEPATSCIAREIIDNAVSATTADPRFAPVTAAELDELIVSVDVLGPAETIAGPRQLDVRRYGVIVTCGRRRGLLLPNLDGVDTVEEQIEIARRKAGIAPDEPVVLQRFEVVRHF